MSASKAFEEFRPWLNMSEHLSALFAPKFHLSRRAKKTQFPLMFALPFL
jgi:hypothetical protein